MAGRIRSIKPEILSDAKAARLSDRAWRLWVSMWILCDDCGLLPADADYLGSQVFWGTADRSAARGLAELVKVGLVQLYVVNGQQFGKICGWSKHQKIDRPSGPKFPAPTEESRTLANPREESRGLDADHDHDHDHDRDRDRDQRATPAGGVLAEVLLNELNEARKRVSPTSRPLQPTSPNLKHMKERIAEGATIEDVRHVIAVCEADCRANPSSLKWFNAVSPFRSDNFARKLADDPARASQREPVKGNARLPSRPRGAVPLEESGERDLGQ